MSKKKIHEFMYLNSSAISLDQLKEEIDAIYELNETSNNLYIGFEYDELYIAYHRDETDSEYNKRIKLETKVLKDKLKRSSEKEKKERALLEKLKAKYEKN
jgi:hypothetical protein